MGRWGRVRWGMLLLTLAVAALGQQGPSPVPAAAAASGGAAYVPTMTFDVASVRESKVDLAQGITMGGGFTPAKSSHLRWQNAQISNLVSMAYPTRANQIDGLQNLPVAMKQAFFNVEAKGDADTEEKLATLDNEQIKLEQEHMLQALLAERFNLKVHWETRQAKTYDLLVSKSGRLKTTGEQPSAEMVARYGDLGVPPISSNYSPKGHEDIGHGATPADIIEMLEMWFAHPVNDKTGLTGKYYFDMKSYGVRRTERRPDDPTLWPPLDDAIEDQLGLKIVASQGPVRTLVVDHMEMPSEN